MSALLTTSPQTCSTLTSYFQLNQWNWQNFTPGHWAGREVWEASSARVSITLCHAQAAKAQG